MATPRTINVFLQKNQVAERINMLNGANGSAHKLFPGYPDLWDEFKAMGIKDIRTHDWYGLSDFDTNIDPSNLTQPTYSVPQDKLDQSRKLLADISNTRVYYENYNNSSHGARLNTATLIYIDKHYQNLGNDINILYRFGRTLGASNQAPNPDVFAARAKQAAQTAMNINPGYQAYPLNKPVTWFEIWNEPDLHSFYDGTPRQFYELYAKAAKNIKSITSNSNLLVGTSGVANPVADDKSYLDDFLDYCKANNVPLDFFSWHHYCDGSSDPFDYYVIGKRIRALLDRKGFKNTKSFLTEWNITPLVDSGKVSAVQTMQTASFICSSLIYMQDAQIDKSYFYRCDGMHLGLFNKDKKYTYAAKAFVAFEKLRSTPYRLDVTTPGNPGSEDPDYDYKQDTLGYTCLAGTDIPLDQTGARKIQILVSNYQIDRGYVTSGEYNFPQYAIDTSSTDLVSIHEDLLKDSPKANNTQKYYIYQAGEDPYPSTISSGSGVAFPSGALGKQNLDYKDNAGLTLNITIPDTFNVKNYEAAYSWLSNDGGITTSLDEAALNTTATPSEQGTISNGTITLNRPEMKEYQVLLVEISLT